MYATDGRALYRVSIVTGFFSQATYFQGCDLNVVEITLDDAGTMYGAGFQSGQAALYRIDPVSGACKVVTRFATDAPWSVGFLRQTLFGDESGAFVVLDTSSGMRTLVMPVMQSVREGCDIVLGTDGATYVSAVVDRTAVTPTNVLQSIDPETARVLSSFTLPQGLVLEGLATARGSMYGFSRDGRVLRVTIDADVTLDPVTTHGGPPHFTGAASMPSTTPR